MDKKILFKTFRNTIGAAAYIYVISQVLNNGNVIFGTGNSSEIIGPFVLLLMFVLSAAIVGGLVFGETVIQFMNKKIKDGVKAAFYSIGWLLIYTLICVLLLSILR